MFNFKNGLKITPPGKERRIFVFYTSAVNYFICFAKYQSIAPTSMPPARIKIIT